MDQTDSPLLKYLEQTGESKTEFAARAGVSPQALSNWLHGTRRPDIMSASLIEKATGGAIPLLSWARRRTRRKTRVRKNNQTA